ncbi:MAG: type II toxin-antitoxin system RelE/ParE family toxin [Candidatus Cybelea sp.]
MKIEYSRQATSDLEQIEDYYCERAGPQVAVDLLDRITGALDRLIRRNPKAGRTRHDLGPDVRMFPVLPYLIFYRVTRSSVYVIRILHGHRDIRPPLASLLVAI